MVLLITRFDASEFRVGLPQESQPFEVKGVDECHPEAVYILQRW